MAASRRAHHNDNAVTRRRLGVVGAEGSVAVFVTIHEEDVGRLIGKALVAGVTADSQDIDRFVVLQARHGQVSDPVTGKPARVHIRIKGM